MGSIRIDIDSGANASVFEVRGEVTAEDIIAAMDRQYVAGSPRHAIWDYSGAALHRLEPEDFPRIAAAAKERAAHRAGGKTAFIASGEQEAIAIKLLEAIARAIELPIPVRICYSQQDAVAWLADGDDTGATA